MIKIAPILLLLSLLFPSLSLGQGETSNWYFGNGAGITFNNDGSVTPITNGKIDTFEGCATISDTFGALLFYTDGILVYDRDHKLMMNGGGLLGDPSSTQSALIIPKPEDPTLFFIFTVDTRAFVDDPDKGLNYSIVDMSLNKGKGAVTLKNIPLLKDCSEKIAAVIKDCSDKSIWLLTFASKNGEEGLFDTFHAFEINTSGLVNKAVKTTFNDLEIEDARGYLKISPDGTKLANANMRDGLYTYDFDAVTGKLSNQKNISISGLSKAPYGIEFSTTNQFLYVHASNDAQTDTGHKSSLLQYDLLAADISNSQETIDERNIYRGALQMGENGKIYRTTAENYFIGSSYLSVIGSPNKKGKAANYQHNVLYLNGKDATQGLPPFVQSLFNKVTLIKNQDGTEVGSSAICAGESISLEAAIIPGASYSWKKDGRPIFNSSNSLDIASSSPNDSGKYQLTILRSDPKECPIIGEALIEIVPLPESNSLTLEQCDVDENSSDGITLINLKQAASGEELEFVFYESLVDQVNEKAISDIEMYTNTQPFVQTIFYEVTNKLGCSNTGKIELIINPTILSNSVLSPYLACNENTLNEVLEATFDLAQLATNYPNSEIAFYTNLSDATLERNPLEENFKTSNTIIYVRIERENQCIAVETIELLVNPTPEIQLNEFYEFCSDGNPLIIDAPIGFDKYTWYKTDDSSNTIVSNNSQVTITARGRYQLEVGLIYETINQTIQCVNKSDFEVSTSSRATFEEITVVDLSTTNSIAALVSGEGTYEFSIDGFTYQNNPLFENVEAGFYTVFARDLNGCGISEREIAVVSFPRFFTPNGDGFNDTWQLIGSGVDMIEGYVAIYDRYGRLLKQINADNQGWDGTFLGKQLPESDYWFKINLTNGTEFKGHFALKR